MGERNVTLPIWTAEQREAARAHLRANGLAYVRTDGDPNDPADFFFADGR